MDPLDIFAECNECNPCKFGAVIFLCHCIITIQVFIRIWLYFRKSAKLVKVTALYVRMSLKCFVTGLM